MPGFASRYLTDEVAFINTGITNAQAGASGTHSGVPLFWGGSPARRWRKLGLILQADLGGSFTGYFMTATGSAATFSTFTPANNTASSVTILATGSCNILYMEARGEMIEDLSTWGYWIRPVIVGGGAVGPAALVALGFLVDNAPARPDPAVNLVTNYLM